MSSYDLDASPVRLGAVVTVIDPCCDCGDVELDAAPPSTNAISLHVMQYLDEEEEEEALEVDHRGDRSASEKGPNADDVRGLLCDFEDELKLKRPMVESLVVIMVTGDRGIVGWFAVMAKSVVHRARRKFFSNLEQMICGRLVAMTIAPLTAPYVCVNCSLLSSTARNSQLI